MNRRILIERLHRCLSIDNYESFSAEIDRLSTHKDFSVRMELASILSGVPHPRAEKTLLTLLGDKNYLVQTEALDSLSSFSSDAVKQAVFLKVHSKYTLVRGYAYRCISDIYADTDSKTARNALQEIQERNTWAKAMLLISLAQLEDNQAYLSLVKMYPRCHYRVRCAILNGLADIYSYLSASTQVDLAIFAQKLMPKEASVQDALRRLKCEIDI